MATDKERFAELLDMQDFQMITSFKQTYVDALKHYYFVGGMPEAVQSFAENKDFNEVREIQKRILAAYEQDFSKHAPNEIVPKIRMLWQDINDFFESESKDRCLISMIWLKQHLNQCCLRCYKEPKRMDILTLQALTAKRKLSL